MNQRNTSLVSSAPFHLGHVQEREPQAASVDASQQRSQLDAAAGGEKGLKSHDKTNQTSK
jgi:hypothetical protein